MGLRSSLIFTGIRMFLVFCQKDFFKKHLKYKSISICTLALLIYLLQHLNGLCGRDGIWYFPSWEWSQSLYHVLVSETEDLGFCFTTSQDYNCVDITVPNNGLILVPLCTCCRAVSSCKGGPMPRDHCFGKLVGHSKSSKTSIQKHQFCAVQEEKRLDVYKSLTFSGLTFPKFTPAIQNRW